MFAFYRVVLNNISLLLKFQQHLSTSWVSKLETTLKLKVLKWLNAFRTWWYLHSSEDKTVKICIKLVCKRSYKLFKKKTRFKSFANMATMCALNLCPASVMRTDTVYLQLPMFLWGLSCTEQTVAPCTFVTLHRTAVLTIPHTLPFNRNNNKDNKISSTD
jgi:hypothetical protein